MAKQPVDVQIIDDYLLGKLTAEEVEHLDEMSLTDDDFAQQLNAVENELVDAYVRGELSGNQLDQFKSHYLASPKRREKVAFAATLRNLVDNSTIAPAERHLQDRGRIELNRFRSPTLQWGLAAALAFVLIAGGYFALENVRLRNQIAQTQTEHAALEKREQELQQQLSRVSSDSAKEKELGVVREKLAALEQQLASGQRGEVKLIALNLSPQTRGIGKISTLTVPTGIEYVAITLELETNDFSSYQVALKNPADSKVLLLSDELKAVESNQSVQFGLPANLLQSQNYLLELSGISASGVPEVVSSYSFRIVRQ